MQSEKVQVAVRRGMSKKLERKAESLDLRYTDFLRLVLALAARGDFDFVAKGVSNEQTATR